ncbi:hypothetical protein COV24_03850 [candidate division WWE3 bacterium CG10_big_fil_rev_8_21_14_0_10_32_10]|uniref:Uncharacterized protein n=1 Tax=candidate division WWE3 bacterium CG10_big_fil_rev_8_21_14_0_10_32_10 TaxID=1975090 RepID=A0A2H0R9R8_UNCKA|nr:MAG: hypothetical protein COV24_03850 [candidate division WWE3 bacterium CG10_big_fil_rev_8_21_14_0_10_32_10]
MHTLNDNFLKSIPVERIVKLENYNIEIPLKYKCKAINLIFSISSERAKSLLKKTNYLPYLLTPRRSLIALTLFDYYMSPVGPYKELSLSLIVHKNKYNYPFMPLFIDFATNKLTFYVINLLQNKKIAIDHGNLITGYPHYNKLIDLSFSKDNNYTFFAEVEEGGKKILELKSNIGKRKKIATNHYRTIFENKHKLFEIKMSVKALSSMCKSSYVQLGEHEIANFLSTLKINKRALYCQYYWDAMEILFSPKSIL